MSTQFAPIWNNASVDLTCIRANVTNTNSGSGSTLLDLLVDGVSKFKVDKDGNLANSSNTFQFGGADVASPVSQTLRVSSVLAGTSNANGADWTLQGSLPSGTGNTGKVVINNSFKGLSGNSTVTISIASPAVVTWTNHLSVPGQAIQFSTTGQLPTGITAGVTYYVMTTGLAGNHNQFQISAVGPLGPAVNTSGTQSGTHTGTWVTNVQNPSLPVALFGPSGIVGSGTQTPALELRQFWQHTSGTGRGLRIACCDTNSTGGNLLECVYGIDPSFSGSPGFWVDTANRTWCNAFIASQYVQAGSLGFFLRNDTQPYRWGGNDDVLLFRDAASILALRRANTAGPTTYPQAFRLYNSVDGTDAAPGSNWERAKIAWSSNVLQIGTEKLGTGSARALELQTDGTTRLTIGAANGNVTVNLPANETWFSLQYAASEYVKLGNVNAGYGIGGGSVYTTPGSITFGSGAASVRANGSVDIGTQSAQFTIFNQQNNTTPHLTIKAVGYTTKPSFAIESTAAQTADSIQVFSDGGTTKTFWVTPSGAATFKGNVTVSAVNLVTDTTTGTKIATATSQKLGFWNATPDAQPTTAVGAATLVGGGGNTITDTDTFDGYTIKQIVKALRNIGLLA